MTLLEEIRACRVCLPFLPHGCRPVLQLDSAARILIVGQAPGRRVHETGIPFNDPSGDRLREWLGVTREQFYDPSIFAIVPMGFCYPGTEKGGDLPPRPECAPLWQARVMAQLPNVGLRIYLGRYSMDHYLNGKGKSVTEIVSAWRDRAPDVFPLPHPSPRNRMWLSNNPWFDSELVPSLRDRVHDMLAPDPTRGK